MEELKGNCDGQDHDRDNMSEDKTSAESSLRRTRQNCGDTADGAMIKEDKNGDSEVTLHPLLIEHVVKKILSFYYWSYSNPNMVSCRQVCKTWHNVITNGMSQKGMVRKLKFDNADSELLDKFLTDMRDTVNLPFDSFEFDVHFFVKKNGNAFREFLNTFSPWIAHLSLKFGKQYSMDLVKTLENNVTDFCSLKTLSVEGTHLFTIPSIESMMHSIGTRSSFTWQPRHPRDLSQGLLVLLQTILSTANELEKVKIYLPFRYLDGEDGVRASTQFGSILANKLPTSVIKLKLIMPLNDSHLSKLTRLKLRKLHLDFYGSQISEQAFKEFLGSQSESLRDLRLVDFENLLTGQNLPECDKVERLFIKGNWFSSLKSFPNLKTLVLLTEEPNDTISESQKMICPKLSELNFRYPIEWPMFFSSVPTYFPNIKTLRTQAVSDSVRAFEAIFQHVTSLNELEINFMESFNKEPLDNIFTGISSSRCDNIRENKMYSNDDQTLILSQTRRKPCLENLRNLKKLIIKTDSTTAPVTDVTVHYALLRCPSLQEVQLVGNHGISDRGILHLRGRFQVTIQRHRLSPYGGAPPEESLENSWALVPFSP